MRKGVALGCVAAVLLVSALAAVGFYFFVWKPGSEAVKTGVEIVRAGKDYAAGFARLGEMAEMDDGIEDRSSYEPPADGVVSEEQMQRFLAVQRGVRAGMDGRMEALGERYSDLTGSAANVTPRRLAEALQELGDLGVEAKRIQVRLVNEQGFSRQEYRWVKRQVYFALGMGGMTVNVDEMVRAAKEGDLEALERSGEGGEPPVPQENVELVEPHRDELQRWAPFAFVGL